MPSRRQVSSTLRIAAILSRPSHPRCAASSYGPTPRAASRSPPGWSRSPPARVRERLPSDPRCARRSRMPWPIGCRVALLPGSPPAALSTPPLPPRSVPLAVAGGPRRSAVLPGLRFDAVELADAFDDFPHCRVGGDQLVGLVKLAPRTGRSVQSHPHLQLSLCGFSGKPGIVQAH